jgi:hypothetical protein
MWDNTVYRLEFSLPAMDPIMVGKATCQARDRLDRDLISKTDCVHHTQELGGYPEGKRSHQGVYKQY